MPISFPIGRSALNLHRLLQAVQLYDRLEKKSFKISYYQIEICLVILLTISERAGTPFFLRTTGNQPHARAFVIPLYQGEFAVQDSGDDQDAGPLQTGKNARAFCHQQRGNEVGAD